MSDPVNLPEAILTSDDIKRRGDEYRRLSDEVRRIASRQSELREWFDTLRKLIGADHADRLIGDLGAEAPSARPAIIERGGKITWTGFIERVVADADGPVAYATLRESIAASELGPILERTDKGFYGGIAKLIEAKRIVKHNGWLFSNAALQKYKSKVSQGVILDITAEGVPKPSPMADKISQLVAEHPDGIASRDIVTHMSGNDEFREAVERSPSSVYNVLARMVKRDQLRKEGSLYFPPDAPNENSDPKVAV